MNITLSDGTTSITLPVDMVWADRHSWSPVEQTVNTSLTGAAIVDVGTRLTGRPLTLQSDEQHAWMPYASVSQIKEWADIAGKQISLTIGADSFQVIFRHHDKPAVDVFAVIDYDTPDAQDWFYGVLKFTEV